MTTPIKVAVTGAAGQIGYSLVFRIANGDMFGKDTPVDLRLVDLERSLGTLEGVKMELDDCAFPLLSNTVVTADLSEGFADTDWVVLVGSVPRKEGMERKDLLEINGKIFVGQGKAIEASASPNVKILVVGNPCNTNCLIAKASAPSIPADRWFAMTALDENRAKYQLAAKASVDIEQVQNMTIWGNHSATQFADYFHATINGKSAPEVIDDDWLQNDFLKTVQQRGATVIVARGASSAASAANAIIDSIKRIITPTPAGQTFSMAVPSDGSYGVPKGLIFSFPLRSTGSGYEIVQGIEHGEFAQAKLDATITELQEEQAAVQELIG